MLNNFLKHETDAVSATNTEGIMYDLSALPEPQKDLPFPLMTALEHRQTIRKWKDAPVSKQDISNLLWAACGQTKKKVW